MMGQVKLFPDEPKEYKVDTFKFTVMSAPIHAVSKAGENYCHLIAKQQEAPFESMKVMGFGGTRELLGQVKVGEVVVLVGNLKDDRGTKTFFAHGLSKPGDEAPRRAFSATEEGIKYYGSREELKKSVAKHIEFYASKGFVPMVHTDKARPEIKTVTWVPKKSAVQYQGRWMLKIDLLMDKLGVEVVNRELKQIVRGIDVDLSSPNPIAAPWRGSYLSWLDKRINDVLGVVPDEPIKIEDLF